MNIEGFGTETIERLLEKKLINDFSDIYKLNLNDLINLERMAKKSAENLISAIEKSKDQPFEKVLFGLGIRYVGETVSKKITSKISDIDKLMKLSFDDLLKIEEIGDKIALSLVKYFGDDDNIEQIKRLKEIGLNFHMVNDLNITSLLSNLKFVITGTYTQISRDNLKSNIEKNGGEVSSSLSKNTSYLILGDNPGPSKLSKAKILGVETITLQNLINKFNLDF